MDTDTVRQKMREQLDQARDSAMTKEMGWNFEDEFTTYITLRPRNQPDKSYLLRIQFDQFPKRAPSFVFVDAQTKAESDSAWPPDMRHGGTQGICIEGTREFYEQIHHNDAQYPYNPATYSFLDTLHRVHLMMEGKVRR